MDQFHLPESVEYNAKYIHQNRRAYRVNRFSKSSQTSLEKLKKLPYTIKPSEPKIP